VESLKKAVSSHKYSGILLEAIDAADKVTVG